MRFPATKVIFIPIGVNSLFVKSATSVKLDFSHNVYCMCVCLCLRRLRLVPGFLARQEADWIFSKLLAELPWSQKTNYRQGWEPHLHNLINQMTCFLLHVSIYTIIFPIKSSLFFSHLLNMLTYFCQQNRNSTIVSFFYSLS